VSSDAKYFARIAGDNLFKDWLARERSAVIKKLAMAVETPLVYRAQGQLQLLDEIEKHLEAGKSMR
jgi:hypothetical protein